MFFFKIFLMQLSVIAISYVYASRSPVEVKRWIMSQALDCNKEQPVSAEELQMLLDMKPPDSTNTKCYVACIFKKIKWLNENGNYDFDKTKEFAEQEYSDNTANMENAKKLFGICKKVNDEPVTDGKSGCDRARLLAQCLIENAPKTGFSLQEM